MQVLRKPEERARRALDRLAFGPRPGETAWVAGIGVEDWIRAELGRAVPPPSEETLPEVPAARRPRSREEVRELRMGMRDLVAALGARRLERAAAAPLPVHDAVFEFWANHFHVYARKGLVEPALLPSYEREVLRPHVLGRFEDMLQASARHPAMLFYLDNWRSAAPGGGRRRAPRRGRGGRGRPAGLNENYARELLELHTLGVDGGYHQGDVEEVARAFTGWTLDRRGGTPVFRFRADWHDFGEKRILGRRFPAGVGVEEGERVLSLLARHPATADHIAHKLAVRFLADDPPPAAVARTARRFRESGGDIRASLEALLLGGEELFARELRKLKTPFELVVSALRATDARLEDPRGALRVLHELGNLPYLAPSPAGYPDRAERWLDPGSVLARTRFAFTLASGRVPGVRVPRDAPLEPAELPAPPLGSGTRRALATPDLIAPERLALALASPEFQLR